VKGADALIVLPRRRSIEPGLGKPKDAEGEVAKPYGFERAIQARVPLRTTGLPHPLELRGVAMTARAGLSDTG
jgi:hypothetical protein